MERENTERIFNEILDLRARGLTQKEIAAEIGYDKSYISRILVAHGIKTDTHKAKKKITEPISDFHFRLGKLIHTYRLYSKCLGIPAMAKEMKLTVRKLTLLEEGKLDITISELQKLFKSKFKDVMAQLLAENDPNEDLFNN